MHFHLPKPLHGWRAFAGEVGVIVLGVLIALGFGQLAETIHEGTIAAEAREAIRAEVRENLWWIDRRAELEPCIKIMLGNMNTLLVRSRTQQATSMMRIVDFPAHSKMTSLRWDTNSQAGRASLFSSEEQRLLGNMYYTTEEYRQSQALEEAVWAKMGFVEGLAHFTTADVHDLSMLLAEARYRDLIARLDIERAHQWANRLHLSGANPNSVEGLQAAGAPVCQQMS